MIPRQTAAGTGYKVSRQNADRSSRLLQKLRNYRLADACKHHVYFCAHRLLVLSPIVLCTFFFFGAGCGVSGVIGWVLGLVLKRVRVHLIRTYVEGAEGAARACTRLLLHFTS